jgi:hypothetical protein
MARLGRKQLITFFSLLDTGLGSPKAISDTDTVHDQCFSRTLAALRPRQQEQAKQGKELVALGEAFDESYNAHLLFSSRFIAFDRLKVERTQGNWTATAGFAKSRL